MFNTGKPVTGSDFYDRSKMLKDIKNMLDNRQDFIIKAPRRYGKTSLIKESLISTTDPALYLDLRRVPRIEIIAEQIMDFVYARDGIKGFFKRLKDDAFALLRESRQTVTVNAEIFEASVEFFAKEREPCEMLIKALETAELIATARAEHYFIIMDEFQDVSRLDCNETDILEILRGTIQHHDSITYVFLGSVEHLMSKIFDSRSSPFYQFARQFKLLPFDIDELYSDLINAFASKKIIIEDETVFKNLLYRLKGHPSNTMMVMQNIYYAALDADIKLVKSDMIERAFTNALEEAGELMDQYINEIKAKKHCYDVIYRLVNKEEQLLEGARLNQVYNALMDMGHVYRENRGDYRLYDGFLIEYIKR